MPDAVATTSARGLCQSNLLAAGGRLVLASPDAQSIQVFQQLTRSDPHRGAYVYPDSSIVRKTACHGAIFGFVMGHDLRRLFVSR